MSYWIVKVKHPTTGRTLYLWDQGMLRTSEFPYGAPGHFDEGKHNAYRFSSGQQAERAIGGMLGLGRKAKIAQVESSDPTRTPLVDKALAQLQRQYDYESDCPLAHLQPDDCSWRAIAALLRYVEALERAAKKHQK